MTKVRAYFVRELQDFGSDARLWKSGDGYYLVTSYLNMRQKWPRMEWQNIPPRYWEETAVFITDEHGNLDTAAQLAALPGPGPRHIEALEAACFQPVAKLVAARPPKGFA